MVENHEEVLMKASEGNIFYVFWRGLIFGSWKSTRCWVGGFDMFQWCCFLFQTYLAWWSQLTTFFSSEIETTHQASPIVSIKEVYGNSNWSVCGWFLFHWDSLICRKAKEWRCRLVWWDSKPNLLTCLKQLTTVLKNPNQPVNLQKMFCSIFNLPTWDVIWHYVKLLFHVQSQCVNQWTIWMCFVCEAINCRNFQIPIIVRLW